MAGNVVKRFLIGLVALLSLAWSFWMLRITIVSLLRGTVHLAGAVARTWYVLRPTAAIAMIWMSVRGLRLATGVDPLDAPRVKVWRVFAGCILLISLARTILIPGSRRYQAINAAQLFGMYLSWVLILLVAAWLIRSAFPSERPMT